MMQANLERALTSSISFGRFMSESLCWEKWSPFSRSRYLEEAKEYSTPGLVAQKKAYFDEYYKKKKIAANKAAALLEQQQATSSNTISQADIDESESRVVTDEILGEKEVPYTDITFTDDAKVSNVLGHNQFSNLVDDSKSSIKVGLPDQSQYIEKESGDRFTQHQNIQKQRNEVASRQGGFVAALKKRLANTGTKLCGSVKPSPVQLTEENNAGKTNKENNGSDFVEAKRVTSNSLHMSIDVGMPSKLPSSFRANIKDSKDITTFAVTSKDSLIPLRTPVTVLVHSFSNTQPEKSDLKPSGSPVQKASPTAVASSFSFKNEERVAKHREFFQGLERKLTKDTEKFHLPPKSKVTERHREISEGFPLKLCLPGDGEMDGPEPCLLRSFSQPSGNSPEPKEANLERALTSSISFGRFMSESLCWEKWSAFSRSRYLEEAKEYSTPGLVAQKKAYFDEYYKKIAANKAAALLEQQQATSSNTFSKADIDESESHVESDEILGEEEVPYTDITFSDDAKVSNVLGHNQFSNLVGDSKSPIKVGLPDQSQYIEKESGDMFIQHQNIQKQRNEVASRQGGLVATLKKRLASTGTKLRGSVKPSPVQLTEENNAGKTNKENNGSDFVEKKRGTSNSLHMSIDVGMPSKPPSSFRANIKDSKDITTFAVTSKDSLIPLRTPLTVLVHSFSNTQPEKSDLKRSGSPVQKASPTAVASSFSFKNEERVAKHREFFQGLERKLTKETEKFHLPPRSKERSVDDFRKVWQTTDFSRPKLIGNPHRGTELQNHQLKAQIPLPQLPKPSKKPIPSISQSTESRPPWRVSGKIDSSKLGLEKSTQNAALSKTPSWRKNKQENASPNIQP